MKMILHSGRLVEFGELKPSDIDIRDIAHALAHTNRYNGHAPSPWSVAQHSLACMSLARHYGEPAGTQLGALLHDAAEAYIGDIIRPVKGMFHGIQDVENVVQNIIYDGLGVLPPEQISRITGIDLMILEAELGWLWKGHPNWGRLEAVQHLEQWAHYTPNAIKYAFIDNYQILKAQVAV